MRKWYTIVALISSVLIAGCGSEEPVIEPEAPPLHTQSESTVWDNKTVNEITPCCAFDSTESKLTIYPYFNDNQSVSVEKLLLSEQNDFWGAITESYKGTDNLLISEGYSLVTLDNGCTLGIIELEESMCYWVTSSELPSSYVQAVLKQLCQ